MCKNTIALLPKGITWLRGRKDNPDDLCAHAEVQFEINGGRLVGIDDGGWCVSAAALYLLRTLEKSHTKDAPLFEHLFPCCGFAMYDFDGEENVYIIGCDTGIDFQIIHVGENIEIKSENDQSFVVSGSEWRKAVIGFSEAVKAFYLSSSPKKVPEGDEEDKKGFKKFMTEWQQRHEAADDSSGIHKREH